MARPVLRGEASHRRRNAARSAATRPPQTPCWLTTASSAVRIRSASATGRPDLLPRLRRAVAACAPRACVDGCAGGHRVARLSVVQGFSVSGCPVTPAVASTATVSNTPRAAVAVSVAVKGAWKPEAAACGADAAPISSAAQPDQRRPIWHPRALQMLSAAAARPAATRPAAAPACRAVTRTRPHRVRSRPAAASSITAIRRRPGRISAGAVVSPPALAAGTSRGRQLIGTRPGLLLQLLTQGVQCVVEAWQAHLLTRVVGISCSPWPPSDAAAAAPRRYPWADHRPGQGQFARVGPAARVNQGLVLSVLVLSSGSTAARACPGVEDASTG